MWFQKPPLGTPLDWGNPLNDETVLALAMNEGHGDKVQDLSLNGNHGTLKNFAFPPTVASGWNPGQTGIGLKFDETAPNHIDCGNKASLNVTDTVTTAVLIKSTGNTFSQRILDRDDGVNRDWIFRLGANGHVYFYIWQGGVIKHTSGTQDLNDDLWHNVVGVYDGDALRVYVDGMPQGTPNTGNPGGIDGDPQEVRVGLSGSDSEGFKGNIDQVRIQSRAWTAKEVKDYTINPWQVYLDEDDM